MKIITKENGLFNFYPPVGQWAADNFEQKHSNSLSHSLSKVFREQNKQVHMGMAEKRHSDIHKSSYFEVHCVRREEDRIAQKEGREYCIMHQLGRTQRVDGRPHAGVDSVIRASCIDDRQRRWFWTRIDIWSF